MTHLSEDEFCEQYVEPLLTDLFGEDAWEDNVWLDKTTCYADYWLDLDLFVAAIEVENDADSIRDGVGQALEYAQNDPRAVPLLLTPEGHVEEAQAEALRVVVPIIEIPTE